MHPGLLGGIIGGVSGLIGGVIGSYFSIKNTNGPKEKAFVKKAVIICWVGVIIFLVLLLYLPKPYNFLSWVPYAIILPSAICYWNKKQQEIRNEEAKDRNISSNQMRKNDQNQNLRNN